ncbi:uncharacterized protein I303_102962 [Kwoniella dejecticola CBS 10117]|uniref:Conserved oligomeric Golgi complex subunit 1 n=1 Tax=Kwoniella dejecticola CBS 10117 TaxID=1296121 RepID=A0A1A6AA71_9TREE|nr:uncharacterized protein I303_02981 [Kwoniella dejecticola CBS 10117]OBR86959.1 hypothetical protein I303_02981 [Kwoniella dejecticola CBS 10117]
MSVRSTPGPSPYPTLPTYNVPESSASTSKRAIRAPSYVSRPSIPSFDPPRQASFSRASIAPSVTGDSTPTLLRTGVSRRKRNENGVLTPTSKDDWAGMEPDEVFRRLPVNEVRRVEGKMRNDALNKQSELRLMVGARYRDLLTSATQIQSLHSSSLRLSDSLREIARSCSNPDINITLDGDGSQDGNDNDDLMEMLPTAAHMKLLLDAPEALYSYLSHQSYLNAAFLWLITRVVKESLTSMPEEQSEAYLPLLQKQWETLLPFRSQIVQRATASLRTKENLESKALSETILAIVLLDNLPIPDALDLLLAQRTRALKETLQHVEVNTAKTPEKTRKRSNSKIQNAAINRSAAQERASISSIITDSVKLMLDTVSSAKAVFELQATSSEDGESVIEEMMRLIQKGETTLTPPITNPPPSSRKNSHQRRASRLASISLPIKYAPQTPSTPSGNHRRPPVTATEILQELPSSQILLRYLPNNIIGFTPFITPSSSPDQEAKLSEWQKSSIELLKQSIPGWLKDLQHVKDIWSVRNSLKTILKEGEFEDAIKEALEDSWSIRVKEVWQEKLDTLLDTAEREVRDAGEKVRNGADKADVSPESYLFSDLAFPSGPSTSTAFNNYRWTLKKKSSYRTPLLDNVLTTFEEYAIFMKEDMSDLPTTLYSDYSEQIQATLGNLIKVFEKVLDSLGPNRGDGKIGIGAEIFVGRIALYLCGSQSRFLKDIAGFGTIDQDGIGKSLLAVHSKSVIRWREKAIQEALVLLAPLFDPYRGPQGIKASWQGDLPSSPSHSIMTALQSLVSSTKSLGIPPTSRKLPIIEQLVTGFVESATQLEGWQTQKECPENALQALVDIGFLVHLAGKPMRDDETVVGRLSDIQSTYPFFGVDNLQETIDQSIRRTQLLLNPLLSHLSPSSTSAPGYPSTPSIGRGYTHGLDNRNAALLRFGAPLNKVGSAGTGTGTEFRSPVVAAKPGKRMGLLSIAA